MSTLTHEISSKVVRRNNKYDNTVVNPLVNEMYSVAPGVQVKLFPYIKDLIVFAAMVGRYYDRKEAVESASTPITLATFSGQHGSHKRSLADQHNIIFMFGLSILRDMKYLHDENIGEVIKVFEEYSNGGLSIIETWLLESGGKPMIIFDKIIDTIAKEKETDFVLPV